jgi:hypothetical protein
VTLKKTLNLKTFVSKAFRRFLVSPVCQQVDAPFVKDVIEVTLPIRRSSPRGVTKKRLPQFCVVNFKELVYPRCHGQSLRANPGLGTV